MPKRRTEVTAEQVAALPYYRKWLTAIKAYERAIEKRSRDEIEQVKVWRARDSADDALSWLRGRVSAAELAEEERRLSRANTLALEAETTAAGARQAYRRAELDRIDAEERDDVHTHYVPGVGYVRGKRVISR